MRVLALYRVSTEKQENEGASLDAQQRRYREIAAANGWTTVAEFRGQESAAKAASERAVLQQVLSCIRQQSVDALWVYEQSRLTRGDELEVALLTRELREQAVKVIVLSNSLDLTNPDDTMVFGLGGLMDRREIQRMKERTMRGRREKARQGKKTGGPTPYGYVNPPPGDPRRGTLQPHPEYAAVVRRIFEATAAGVTSLRLCAELNSEGIQSPAGKRWLHTTIGKIIRNPVYLGMQFLSTWTRKQGMASYSQDLRAQNAIVIQGAHEPLVTPELAAAAQAERAGWPTGRPGMLTGLLWVEGRRVQMDVSGGDRYYRPAEGAGPWVPVTQVNDLVWQGFVGLLGARKALVALLRRARNGGSAKTLEASLEQLAARREKLQAKLDRLVEMRADGEIPRDVFMGRSDEVRRQLAELGDAEVTARHRAAAVRGGYHRQVVMALANVVAAGELSMRERRRVLRSLVARVDVELGAPVVLQRGERGRLVGGHRKWAPRAICLQLRRYPGPDTTPAGSDRTLVQVQIVADGQLISTVDALRRALAEVA